MVGLSGLIPICRKAVSLIKRVMMLLSSTHTQVLRPQLRETVLSADLNVSLQSNHISLYSLPPVHHVKVYLQKTPKANGGFATSDVGVISGEISTYSACCSVCHASFSSTTWTRYHTTAKICKCYGYTASSEIHINCLYNIFYRWC